MDWILALLLGFVESAEDRRRRKLRELEQMLDDASADGLGVLVAVVVTTVFAVVGAIVAVAKVFR